MTAKQVAEELGISPSTVARMVKRGALKARPVAPALLRPKALEFDRSEIERYKSSHS